MHLFINLIPCKIPKGQRRCVTVATNLTDSMPKSSINLSDINQSARSYPVSPDSCPIEQTKQLFQSNTLHYFNQFTYISVYPSYHTVQKAHFILQLGSNVLSLRIASRLHRVSDLQQSVSFIYKSPLILNATQNAIQKYTQ